jgi:hypothetical protein
MRTLVLDTLTSVFDGARGIRTPDLYNANVALSQLSHSPACVIILP